jgi:uncharacterized membrane protein YfcA
MGLGGGVIMVPYMTIVMGLDIKEAVPISMIAIVVGTLSASRSYLQKSMVDKELAVIIAVFMVIGSVTGSLVSELVSSAALQLMFSIVTIYAGIMMLIKKNEGKHLIRHENRQVYYVLAALISFVTGIFAALIGLGGGIFIIPILYLLFGKSIDTARGTSTLTIGFAAAAAAIVYFFNGLLDPTSAAPVILGVAVGGTIGGHLGTAARPAVVKIIFFIIMLYIAYKLGYQGWQNL